ncbi:MULTISPECIES: hypothetical protein [Haloarcula]|uniref:hypothetical protein n=1 Tax=Haloarcula TaxID=2237 RepID=UPI0023E7B624|nr:hypothetical protein [Halomicroarcula sp. SHR3]
MGHQSPLKFDGDDERTLFDLFKSLFLLFLALGTLRVFNRSMLFRAWSAVRSTPDSVLTGTAVYAGTGLVILCVVVVLWRARRPAEQRVQRGTLIRYGGVATVSLVVAAYLLHRNLTLPVFPRELLIAVSNGLVVMGLFAVRYTRARDIDLPLSKPDRTGWATAMGTSLLAAIVGLGGRYRSMRTVETIPQMPFDRAGMGGVWPVELVLSGVFLGFGWGLLFHGAVQTALRDRLGTAAGVTATAALSGSPLVVSSALDVSVWELNALPRAAFLTADNFMLVVMTLALVQGIWFLSRQFGIDCTPVLAVVAVVLVVALVSLAIEESPFVPLTVSFAFVAALATVGYERSGSVWVPVAAYVSYQIFSTMEAVRFLVGVPV